MTTSRPAFRAGLFAALPIVLGYAPIAFSFGVAATRAGLTGAEAVMLSVVIYAGASQFLALALVTSGAPALVAAFTLIAMNVRHVLYGPALMRQAGSGASRRHAWAWAWGLTDEVFGQALGALARGQRFSESYMFGLGLAAYMAWIGGTAAGAWAGGGALDRWPAVSAGLGFMLTALFLALLLSVLSRATLRPVAVAALACTAGSLALSPAWGILAGMLGGALAGLLRR
ncbi:branched-chain amino acid ABC transporter permease [Aliigemmobacter aestuarii]|uniref:Branched-chain amino acid ABC transporter permease n=1 Tax=Aliigemmobacter aestuarii TaxID=1445661 RepID=A0A4S3MJ66_9RHOB|nr:AzlC family ABC transporter permease [Gemmobacter aestuarii]THD81465.1 branched-chain amino acid ABC transporter permease [Gemmobacter aestuarii]